MAVFITYLNHIIDFRLQFETMTSISKYSPYFTFGEETITCKTENCNYVYTFESKSTRSTASLRNRLKAHHNDFFKKLVETETKKDEQKRASADNLRTQQTSLKRALTTQKMSAAKKRLY